MLYINIRILCYKIIYFFHLTYLKYEFKNIFKRVYNLSIFFITFILLGGYYEYKKIFNFVRTFI